MTRHIALCALLLWTTGCINLELPLFGGPLEQQVVLGQSGPKVLLLDIDGTIGLQPESNALGFGGGESMTARIRQQLDLAARDGEIRAVVLRINSPGGSAIASQILHGEILRFKATHDVPVVAQMLGMATSGGYYVAMAADQVRAYPTAITGSIGVIMMGFDVSGLMDKVGVASETMVTGPFKDSGSPFRPMRDEERAHLQAIGDDLLVSFVEAVDAGRPALDRAQVEGLADGKIYTARQALANGLIDAVGDLESAVEAARDAAGLSGEVRVVAYARPGERRENLFSMSAPVWNPQLGAQRWNPLFQQPGFFYLWMPGAGGMLP